MFMINFLLNYPNIRWYKMIVIDDDDSIKDWAKKRQFDYFQVQTDIFGSGSWIFLMAVADNLFSRFHWFFFLVEAELVYNL